MCSNCDFRQARIEELEDKLKLLMFISRELSALLNKSSIELYNFLENLSEQGMEIPADNDNPDKDDFN